MEPRYNGNATVQSHTPSTAEEPSKAPQLKAAPTISIQFYRFKNETRLTQHSLRPISNPLHQWI